MRGSVAARPTHRLRGILLSASRSQLVVGVLLAALGFAVVTQVRSTELDDTY